ncbi:MAG: DUF6522 family protein [Gammaproteobacteria bacterium]
MSRIEFENGAVSVDATLIAAGLKIVPELVHPGMRDGTITSRCERGLDQDAGRYRLTFFHGTRRFRLVVDEAGNVVENSGINIGPRRSSR